MASAIGAALISTSLSFMADKAMDSAKRIVKYIADKAVDKAVDKVMDKPMDKVMAMVVDKVDGIVNIERDISKLRTTLRMIQSIVRVAEEKQIDNDFIRNWMHDLVDIAYEARDVLDEFNTFSSCINRAEDTSNPVNFISSLMLSYFGRLKKDIRSVRERFDEKKEEGETFWNLISVVGGGGGIDRRPIVGPSINKRRDALFSGRGEVKQRIMEEILHPSDDNTVNVVAIWGMGGIGKTSLAQSIYNDEKVKEDDYPTENRRWLYVGENKLSAEKVIREIINNKETFGIGNLQTKLKEKLKGDRFLIVLDDVWDVDGSEWNLLFNPLTNVGKGGLIIITTRCQEVCTATNTQTTHHLEPLSEEDSWSIFKSYAFVDGNSDSALDLKGIGKKIVKKLSGHPLALKVVGRSLLRKDSSTWTNFLEYKFTKEDEVMSALKWSYNHLAQHLKTCFIYCSLFPKGHVFTEKVLVEMWMAHDVIQKEKQKQPEDVGACYIKQLINASLLQCVDGKYMMYDLIHDLALLLSNVEFATANGSLSIDQRKKVRHITITPGDYLKIPRLCKIEKLLTLYTICGGEEDAHLLDVSILDDIFKQLKSIRVLVLCGKGIKEIPDCISELKHLRYLDVSETRVESFPYSLCHLYSLQMIAAPTYAVLPRDIVNICSLRYVRAILPTCKGVGKLTSLQELSSIRMCKDDNIRELRNMQELRGKLRIEGLENVEKLEDDVGILMEKQTCIDELELVFDKQLEKSTISEEVLDALGCPPNLTYLGISGYTGVKPPSWMVGGKLEFHKLQTLQLRDCPKLESLPPLGELISLKHLSLVNVGVKRLGDEFYGKFTDRKVFFPSLESLSFDNMEEFEEWDDIIIENFSMSFFPRLTRLDVKKCAKLVMVLPIINAANFMTHLSCLEISYCDRLKLLPLDALVSLKDLYIGHCKSLVQITSATCLATTIEGLEIYSCEHLETMDFGKLPSLKHLDVSCCKRLISIPRLVGIKDLSLLECHSLRSLSINIHGLDSLKNLDINGCPVLELTIEEGSSYSSSGNSVADPIYISTDNDQILTKLLHHNFVSLKSLFNEKLARFENFGETKANNFDKLKSFLADFHNLYIKSFPQLQPLHQSDDDDQEKEEGKDEEMQRDPDYDTDDQDDVHSDDDLLFATKIMASAIGTAMVSTILQPVAAKARDIIKDKSMDKAIAMVVGKIDGIANIERDIDKLQTTLGKIEEIVQEAEEMQIDNADIQNWLRDLVDIGYEARDVLDDFIAFSSCIIKKEEASNQVNFISSYMLSYIARSSSDASKLPLTVLNRLEKDIRSVRVRFDKKKKEGDTFAILRSVEDQKSFESVREYDRPEVGHSVNQQRKYPFFGREHINVKEGIMEKILHPSDDNTVRVILIWGMGGIGKTTIVQSIYNDERVKEDDYTTKNRRWFCVGENKFSAEKVIKEIVNDQNTIGIGKLQERLVKELRGDRFLIVLDDVWDVDGSEWNLLFDPLTDVGKGGLIIITTRRREVCTATNTQTTYHLKPLSEEDSLSIFESSAFIDGNADSTPDLDLKCIGKKIVKKLYGLPLALKVVGCSLLEKDSSTWTNFLESNEWTLRKEKDVMSALIWSYNHLPRHIKMCFTYCSLFPKDHVFVKEVLVEMWMAQDFIKKEEQKRPEEVGAQYFKELENASLLQCVDGKYVMHDTIQDLALFVSNEEFATANGLLSTDQMGRVRHISITPGGYSEIPRLCKIEKLLTLYTICSDEKYINWFDGSVLDDVFEQLKSIRVLVLSSEWIYEIPDSISKLKHLRYLDVSKTSVESLPDSLCHLYNLQMIAAPHLFNRVKLPIDIVNISSLRYIRAKLSTCKGVGKLTSLQELSSIHVCKGDNIRELGDMQILRGKLRIEGLENVEKLENDVGALMGKQTLMDELVLQFDKQLEKSTISEEVLDALGCPPKLTYLQISGYTGVKSPSWMVDGKHKLDKLQTLVLSDCSNLESLPPLGELISLKHLSLTSLHGVKRLGDEFYGKFTDSKVFFPSLESLGFYKMQEWEEWEDIIIENFSVSFFPRLTTLEIKECAKLVSLLFPITNAADVMTSLSRLEICDCGRLNRLQLDDLVSFKELTITRCSSLVKITSAICPATTIERLEIYNCELLEKMDFERLPSLKHLDVICCNKLISIPCLLGIKFLNLYGCESLRSLNINIHGLDSKHLNIYNCPVLELKVEEGSSSSVRLRICTDKMQIFTKLFQHKFVLESLNIEKFTGFENFGETQENHFYKLSSLNSLKIQNCPKLQSLSVDFHKLSSLKKLEIISCPQLQSLPPDFHTLTSLNSLKIVDCPQLRSLPAGGFPPSMKSLELLNCPLLYERCKDESGFDWHKIKCIPKLTIFGDHKVHMYGGDR